jgi:hypothetical protein
MRFDAATYVANFPITPYGGLFLAALGLCLILGAFVSRGRMILVGIGFALGVAAMMLFGAKFAAGLGPPNQFQVGSLALAVVLEVAAFAVFMPKLRIHGARATLLGMLAIVGVHFIVMLPAFGPLIGALGALCALNAAAAWRAPFYPSGAVWFVDGVLKLGFGALMLRSSPCFR